MAQYVTTSQLSGLYKEAYADGIGNLIPEKAVLMKALGDVSETERVGNKYHQPVIVALEQGFTYGGAASTAGAYTLNAAIAMTMGDAQLEGSEATHVSQIALGTLSKAASSAKAFKKAFGVVLESNLTSHAIRKELELLYGQSPTGIASTASSVNIGADSTTVQFATAGWAPGIFAGMEGCQVEFFRSDTNAKLGGGAFQLTSVDIDAKKAVVTRTASAAALDTGIAATTCYMAFAGARGAAFTNMVEAPGLDYAVTLASGNTLWNVSTSYSLWRGNTYDCKSGALTFGKTISGVNKAVGRAGLSEDIDLYCSVDTWPSLADSFSAARVLDSSYTDSEGKTGVRKITYAGVNGLIRVTGHPCVKSGEAFAVPLKRCKKVGSSDVTPNVPGRGDELFVLVSGVNAVEFRTYSDFCFFTEAPAKIVKFTNIVNP